MNLFLPLEQGLLLNTGQVRSQLLSSPPLCTHLRQTEGEGEVEFRMGDENDFCLHHHLSASQFGSAVNLTMRRCVVYTFPLSIPTLFEGLSISQMHHKHSDSAALSPLMPISGSLRKWFPFGPNYGAVSSHFSAASQECRLLIAHPQKYRLGHPDFTQTLNMKTSLNGRIVLL